MPAINYFPASNSSAAAAAGIPIVGAITTQFIGEIVYLDNPQPGAFWGWDATANTYKALGTPPPNAFIAADQAAMLGQGAQDNDICIRSDLNGQWFVLTQTPANTLGNWVGMPMPAAQIAKTLASNIAPTAPVINQLWTNTNLNLQLGVPPARTAYWNGTAWVLIDTINTAPWLRHQAVMTGAHDATWINNNLNWTSRFLCVAAGQNANASTSGFFTILMPTVGTTITGIGGAASQTVSANGINMFTNPNGSSVLYYKLPINQGSATINTNFFLCSFGVNITIPDDYVMVASFNNDNGSVKLGSGAILKPQTANEKHSYCFTSSSKGVITGTALSPFIFTKQSARSQFGNVVAVDQIAVDAVNGGTLNFLPQSVGKTYEITLEVKFETGFNSLSANPAGKPVTPEIEFNTVGTINIAPNETQAAKYNFKCNTVGVTGSPSYSASTFKVIVFNNPLSPAVSLNIDGQLRNTGNFAAGDIQQIIGFSTFKTNIYIKEL